MSLKSQILMMSLKEQVPHSFRLWIVLNSIFAMIQTNLRKIAYNC